MDHELFNDNDNFEQFLKESTEDFKMYPSRKVWYSLYNNLHPGSKWPSLAVCLILISAILFMDVSNNNKINKRSQSASNAPIENYFTSYFTQFEEQKATAVLLPVLTNNRISNNNNVTPNLNNTNIGIIENNTNLYTEETQKSFNVIENIPQQTVSTNTINKNNNLEHLNSKTEISTPINNNNLIYISSVPSDNIFTNSEKLNLAAATSSKTPVSVFENLLLKSYQDDHAFYNKPFLSKFMKNASLQFYITPSIGYRAWFKNKDIKQNNNNALIAINPNQQIREEVNQNAAYNMEVGMALNYNLSEKFRVKMGVQFNSTNYVINAGQLFHPTQTTILLENANTGISSLEPHTSYFSNRQASGNDARIFNKTTQLSVPLGLDFQLAKKKNISWHVGATIQPTYIATGEANVLSSDGRNYVKMPSLLRTWNANSSIETFVSIETKAGFSVNVGPQFRYQLLSTYNKEYNYSEKLYNIGIKLGITRGF